MDNTPSMTNIAHGMGGVKWEAVLNDSRKRFHGLQRPVFMPLQWKGLLHFFITEIKCRKASFCSGDSVRQASNISRCSPVSSTMSPSAKNWASVMLNPLQICSSVATEGVVLRLNMFATVDWDSPDSIANRYSLQFSSSNSSRIRCFASTSLFPILFLHYFIAHLNGIVVGLCIDK